MTPIILPASGPNGARILSAVRLGTSDTPAEFIVIADCGEGTPTERYATWHVYAWPGRTKFDAGEYNLTWQQARRSLAERAYLIPPRDIEVTVIAREPHHADILQAFVDGATPDAASRITVRTEVFYLDPDNEDDHEVRDGLRRAATLSPAAAGHVADILRDFAREQRIEADDE
jgi:hypothetical protein